MPTTENLLTEPAHYKELRQTGILPEFFIIGTAKHAANKFVRSRWFAIRISGSMVDKIKYIAAYQVAPVSGISHTEVRKTHPRAVIAIIPSDRCSQTDLASRSFPELARTPTDEARSR